MRNSELFICRGVALQCPKPPLTPQSQTKNAEKFLFPPNLHSNIFARRRTGSISWGGVFFLVNKNS
jgi:hypothetical protein